MPTQNVFHSVRKNVAGLDNNLRLLKRYKHCEISRYRRSVDEVFALRVCYAVYIGRVLPTFSLIGPTFKGQRFQEECR